MKRILFVDDQPEVLNGIKRMLFDKTDEWSMDFVQNGEAALKVLEQDSFDVVVADMRMPGMDGADLLNEVARIYPFIIRIILSGHSEQEMIMKSVGATHQFLAKPLNGDRLEAILNRAFGLRELLSDQKLRSSITTMNSLPSLPTVYYRLIQELQDPAVTMTQIGELIAEDIGMTAKMMQLVNSSFFGLPVHVSDPGHAAKLLGADIIKGLVLSVHIFSIFDKVDVSGFSIESFTEHSLAVASLAKKIAATMTTEKKVADNALIGGMLHDIGKLILAEYKTAEYKKAMTMMTEQEMADWQAEKEVIGTSHSEVGGYLLGIWGLPDELIECATFHHQPGNCLSSDVSPVTAVHIANALVETDKSEQPDSGPALDMKYLKKLRVEGKVAEWQHIYEVQCEA